VRSGVALALAAGVGIAGTTAAAGTPPSATVMIHHSSIVLDGMARFEVLTPTLIRMEYAVDGQFENRPTMTAVNRDLPIPRYTVTKSLGALTITTSALRLTYLGVGPFTPANVTVTIGSITAHPAWDLCQDVTGNCSSVGLPGLAGAIGGWTPEVSSESVGGHDAFPPLHPGVLSTNGWYLLDDTGTAVLDSPTHAVARPVHLGTYQDGYFFGYGSDYARGLKDFAELTGDAPLLPEWTFGPWFSDYDAIPESVYETQILPAFRSHHVPLDGLVVDTNFKAPDSWNGWNWNKSLFPHPKAFFGWAKRNGLHVLLNIHPSIDSTDPQFAKAQRIAGGTLQEGNCQFYRSSPPCYVFDWGKPKQVKAYFALQEQFVKDGISAFWLDWCCDSSTVSTAGLTPDSWISQLYAQRSPDKGRGFVMARVGSGVTLDNGYTGDLAAADSGAWADHRSAIGFTGDGTSDFQTLAFEAKLTPAEGASIGLPYLSNDIGGYSGDHLPDDLYLRWVEMGAFSPIMRLHSDHGQRLPWQYDAKTAAVAERYLRLRQALVPYLYTTADQAHTDGLPMAREPAIDWPHRKGALGATSEWMLGDNLLVAPVVSASNTESVWIPPGEWTNLDTGATVTGPTTMSVTAGLGAEPVWARGVTPLGPDRQQTGGADPLTILVAPGSNRSFDLYADSGDGAGYLHGESATTRISTNGQGSVRVAPTRGTFPGARAARADVIEFLAASKPKGVRLGDRLLPQRQISMPGAPLVTTGEAPRSDGWTYLAKRHIVIVELRRRPVDEGVKVRLVR
jgi:Glycosyl hydrolases family 31/Domain of unknown function (DUF5110)